MATSNKSMYMNGAEIDKLVANGVNISKAYMNGELVFTNLLTVSKYYEINHFCPVGDIDTIEVILHISISNSQYAELSVYVGGAYQSDIQYTPGHPTEQELYFHPNTFLKGEELELNVSVICNTDNYLDFEDQILVESIATIEPTPETTTTTE